jgi:hypothetical protein
MKLDVRRMLRSELLTAARPDVAALRKSCRAIAKALRSDSWLRAIARDFWRTGLLRSERGLLGSSRVGRRPENANRLLTGDSETVDIIQHMESVCD